MRSATGINPHSPSGLAVFSHTDRDQEPAIKCSLGSQGTTEALLFSLSPLRSLTAHRSDKMIAVPPFPLTGTSFLLCLSSHSLPALLRCLDFTFVSCPAPKLSDIISPINI